MLCDVPFRPKLPSLPLSVVYCYYDIKGDVNYRLSMLPYKTWRSILWFILTWIVTIGLLIGAGTSYWITGPEGRHFGFMEDCKMTNETTGWNFACHGFRMDFSPILLLVIIASYGVGVLAMVLLAMLTLVYCFCDQLTACGRSFHTLAGIWQATAAVIALVGVALFPVLWGDPSIQAMCGDSGVYELGDCQLGYSFYIAIVCCVLGYFTAGFCVSLDRDSMRVVAFESMDNLDDYTKDGV